MSFRLALQLAVPAPRSGEVGGSAGEPRAQPAAGADAGGGRHHAALPAGVGERRQRCAVAAWGVQQDPELPGASDRTLRPRDRPSSRHHRSAAGQGACPFALSRRHILFSSGHRTPLQQRWFNPTGSHPHAGIDCIASEQKQLVDHAGGAGGGARPGAGAVCRSKPLGDATQSQLRAVQRLVSSAFQVPGALPLKWSPWQKARVVPL